MANKERFKLGRTLATPGALAVAEPEEMAGLMARHHSGDWGDLSQDDLDENELSVEQGYRVLSAYLTRSGDKLWIITEADRSSTTVLLPEEY